jgi:hypothetical protein
MHAEQASKPHSEFPGGTVVRGTCVRVSEDLAPVGIPGQPAAVSPASEEKKGGEPRIEIIRSGDVIQAIEVICGCGEQIRLQCHYTDV